MIVVIMRLITVDSRDFKTNNFALCLLTATAD